MIIDIIKGFVTIFLFILLFFVCLVISPFMIREWVDHDKMWKEYKSVWHTYWKNMYRLYFKEWGEF